jgi:hypothetical protein
MKNVMKNMRNTLLVIPAMLLLAGVLAPTALAVDPDKVNCNDDGKVSLAEGVKCTDTGQSKPNLGGVIKQVTNVLLFILGAVAVIMIIIGGIKYTISNGDSGQITSAKNTILYSVIGLIVALLAFAIVNFVLDSFMAGNGSDASQTKTD